MTIDLMTIDQMSIDQMAINQLGVFKGLNFGRILSNLQRARIEVFALKNNYKYTTTEN